MGESNTRSNVDIPKFGRLVETKEEFYDIAKYVAHFAVKRHLGYFHHYIVAGWFEAKEKIIEYYVCFKNFFTGPGQVAKHDISKEKIEKCINEKKLYIIEAPGYPKTELERKQAKMRCWKRLGEQAYTLASNNCEHLVNYIMTGLPYSEQVMNAGVWKKLFIDSADNVICHGKRNMLKLSGCLLAVKPASYFVRNTVSEVLSVAVGRAAIKEALKKTAGVTFVITGFIESGMTAYEINKLNKQRKAGVLSKRDFHREVTKSVLGAVSATAGTVAGGVIGQALCPIPVLGFAIGSALGNYFGRWFGSAASGQVFDIIT